MSAPSAGESMQDIEVTIAAPSRSFHATVIASDVSWQDHPAAPEFRRPVWSSAFGNSTDSESYDPMASSIEFGSKDNLEVEFVSGKDTAFMNGSVPTSQLSFSASTETTTTAPENPVSDSVSGSQFSGSAESSHAMSRTIEMKPVSFSSTDKGSISCEMITPTPVLVSNGTVPTGVTISEVSVTTTGSGPTVDGVSVTTSNQDSSLTTGVPIDTVSSDGQTTTVAPIALGSTFQMSPHEEEHAVAPEIPRDRAMSLHERSMLAHGAAMIPTGLDTIQEPEEEVHITSSTSATTTTITTTDATMDDAGYDRRPSLADMPISATTYVASTQSTILEGAESVESGYSEIPVAAAPAPAPDAAAPEAQQAPAATSDSTAPEAPTDSVLSRRLFDAQEQTRQLMELLGESTQLLSSVSKKDEATTEAPAPSTTTSSSTFTSSSTTFTSSESAVGSSGATISNSAATEGALPGAAPADEAPLETQAGSETAFGFSAEKEKEISSETGSAPDSPLVITSRPIEVAMESGFSAPAVSDDVDVPTTESSVPPETSTPIAPSSEGPAPEVPASEAPASAAPAPEAPASPKTQNESIVSALTSISSNITSVDVKTASIDSVESNKADDVPIATSTSSTTDDRRFSINPDTATESVTPMSFSTFQLTAQDQDSAPTEPDSVQPDMTKADAIHDGALAMEAHPQDGVPEPGQEVHITSSEEMEKLRRRASILDGGAEPGVPTTPYVTQTKSLVLIPEEDDGTGTGTEAGNEPTADGVSIPVEVVRHLDDSSAWCSAAPEPEGGVSVPIAIVQAPADPAPSDSASRQEESKTVPVSIGQETTDTPASSDATPVSVSQEDSKPTTLDGAPATQAPADVAIPVEITVDSAVAPAAPSEPTVAPEASIPVEITTDSLVAPAAPQEPAAIPVEITMDSTSAAAAPSEPTPVPETPSDSQPAAGTINIPVSVVAESAAATPATPTDAGASPAAPTEAGASPAAPFEAGASPAASTDVGASPSAAPEQDGTTIPIAVNIVGQTSDQTKVDTEATPATTEPVTVVPITIQESAPAPTETVPEPAQAPVTTDQAKVETEAAPVTSEPVTVVPSTIPETAPTPPETVPEPAQAHVTTDQAKVETEAAPVTSEPVTVVPITIQESAPAPPETVPEPAEAPVTTAEPVPVPEPAVAKTELESVPQPTEKPVTATDTVPELEPTQTRESPTATQVPAPTSTETEVPVASSADEIAKRRESLISSDGTATSPTTANAPVSLETTFQIEPSEEESAQAPEALRDRAMSIHERSLLAHSSSGFTPGLEPINDSEGNGAEEQHVTSSDEFGTSTARRGSILAAMTAFPNEGDDKSTTSFVSLAATPPELFVAEEGPSTGLEPIKETVEPTDTPSSTAPASSGSPAGSSSPLISTPTESRAIDISAPAQDVTKPQLSIPTENRVIDITAPLTDGTKPPSSPKSPKSPGGVQWLAESAPAPGTDDKAPQSPFTLDTTVTVAPPTSPPHHEHSRTPESPQTIVAAAPTQIQEPSSVQNQTQEPTPPTPKTPVGVTWVTEPAPGDASTPSTIQETAAAPKTPTEPAAPALTLSQTEPVQPVEPQSQAPPTPKTPADVAWITEPASQVGGATESIPSAGAESTSAVPQTPTSPSGIKWITEDANQTPAAPGAESEFMVNSPWSGTDQPKPAEPPAPEKTPDDGVTWITEPPSSKSALDEPQARPPLERTESTRSERDASTATDVTVRATSPTKNVGPSVSVDDDLASGVMTEDKGTKVRKLSWADQQPANEENFNIDDYERRLNETTAQTKDLVNLLCQTGQQLSDNSVKMSDVFSAGIQAEVRSMLDQERKDKQAAALPSIDENSEAFMSREPPPQLVSGALPPNVESVIVSCPDIKAVSGSLVLANANIMITDDEVGLFLLTLDCKVVRHVYNANWKHAASPCLFKDRLKSYILVLMDVKDDDGQWARHIVKFTENLDYIEKVECPKWIRERTIVSDRLAVNRYENIYYCVNGEIFSALYELAPTCKWTELLFRQSESFIDMLVFAIIGPIQQILIVEGRRDHVLLCSIRESQCVEARRMALCERPGALARDECGRLFVMNRAAAAIQVVDTRVWAAARNMVVVDKFVPHFSAAYGMLVIPQKRAVKVHKYAFEWDQYDV